MQAPSKGRIVHFTPTEGGEPLVGIITKVWSSNNGVNLAVFDESGSHVGGRTSVPHSDVEGADPAPFSWRYPPRV